MFSYHLSHVSSIHNHWNQSRKQSFAKITIKRLRTHDRKPLANEIHRDSILDSIKKKVILRNVCEKKFATNLSDNGGHKEGE